MEQVADRALYATKGKKKNRVWEIDALRGLCVIAMCFDHFMCDFVYLDGWFSNYYSVHNPFIEAMVKFATAYWNSAFRFWAHYIFVFLFLFLVGTSCAFSRDNTRRGCLLFVVAWVFTGGSLILKQIGILEDGIIFGILDCIALSIMCASAVDIATGFNKKFNVVAPLVIGLAIISAGIGARFWISSPYDLNGFVPNHMTEYIIGTIGYGDDWFPIFPYVGMVLVGVYWGKTAYVKRTSLLPKLDGKWNKPFRFVGQHALIFYILHQGLLSGLVLVLGLCLGYVF